jgi:hypothetical protein
MSDDTPEPHPEREEHLCAARVGDVAEVDDVAGLPTEPFEEAVGDLAFRHRVVATDEQVASITCSTSKGMHLIWRGRVEKAIIGKRSA